MHLGQNQILTRAHLILVAAASILCAGCATLSGADPSQKKLNERIDSLEKDLEKLRAKQSSRVHRIAELEEQVDLLQDKVAAYESALRQYTRGGRGRLPGKRLDGSRSRKGTTASRQTPTDSDGVSQHGDQPPKRITLKGDSSDGRGVVITQKDYRRFVSDGPQSQTSEPVAESASTSSTEGNGPPEGRQPNNPSDSGPNPGDESASGAEQGTSPTPPREDSPSERAPASDKSSAPSDEDSEQPGPRLFERGLEAYRNQRYTDASTYFEEFLGQNPEQRRHAAHYWLGLAQYRLENYEAAIRHLTAVVESDTPAQKRSNAMLKIGRAHLQLGNDEDGKRALKKLVKYYPDRSAADVAERRLDTMPTSGDDNASAEKE